MLNAVFPMAVGPIIVIRYFIIYFSADKNEYLDDCKLLFPDVKRPFKNSFYLAETCSSS
jgi:hypothetical protein